MVSERVPAALVIVILLLPDIPLDTDSAPDTTALELKYALPLTSSELETVRLWVTIALELTVKVFVVRDAPIVALLLTVSVFVVRDEPTVALLLTVNELAVRDEPIVALLLTVREFAVRDAETVRLLLAATASLNVWAAVHVLALFRAARVPLVGSVTPVMPERV